LKLLNPIIEENRENGKETSRKAVDDHKVSSDGASSNYSGINESFMAVTAELAGMSSSGELVDLSSAYINFLLGKERAGIEQTVLSNTFAAGNFAPGMYRKFLSLVTERDVYIQVFLSFAPEIQQEFYRRKMSADVVSEVKRMETIAMGKSGGRKLLRHGDSL